jgi:hypothetical protein
MSRNVSSNYHITKLKQQKITRTLAVVLKVFNMFADPHVVSERVQNIHCPPTTPCPAVSAQPAVKSASPKFCKKTYFSIQPCDTSRAIILGLTLQKHHTKTHTHITYSILRQVHTVFQSEFSNTLRSSDSSRFFKVKSSSLYLPPHLPFTSILPSILPSIARLEGSYYERCDQSISFTSIHCM